MASALRPIALFSLATALFVGLGMPACSQQGEGERCDKAKAGNNDCEAGLTCVSSNDLIDPSSDRCCSTSSNDTRCTRRSESSGTSGTGGTGGSTSVGDGGKPNGDEGGSAPGGMSTAGTTSQTPDAGSGSGGTPAMTDGGAPAAGASQLPASGQGGAD